MISTRFALDHPRLEVADFRPLLPLQRTEISVQVEVDFDGTPVHQQIRLVAEDMPRRRGVRWWVVCPRCSARSGHLYPVPDLACRRCADLRYASQYERS